MILLNQNILIYIGVFVIQALEISLTPQSS